jgi:hypothetical protein
MGVSMSIIQIRHLFAIAGFSNFASIETELFAKYPREDILTLSPSFWLLVAPRTAKEVCDNLGITEGAVGSAMVLACSSYFGRADPQIWEWIASRMEARLG